MAPHSNADYSLACNDYANYLNTSFKKVWKRF